MTHEDQSTDRDGGRDTSSEFEDGAPRRRFLTTGGTLAIAAALGTGSTTARTTSETTASRAPETMDQFEDAVEETVARARAVIDDGPFDPEWDSLADVTQVPEWFRDGKFGIFCHWGPYSVPAYAHEWYPRQLYNTDNEINDYHRETYGEPDEHPYQEFVPEFTAEAFDADEWAALFERAGARYAGPVVEHHDGWSLWDSDVTPWNAADTGPERDLTGELESAIRNRDMRFVTTFHHSYNLIGEDGYFSFAYENYPSVTEGYPDRVLYGNLPERLQFETWLAKLVEVVRGYDPDFVWFDWGLPDVPEEYRRRFLAYYHNAAAKRGKEVVTTNKEDALPLESSVADFELGRPRHTQEQAWNAEFKVADEGGWGYVENRTFHSPTRLIHVLIDVVSKNGQLLLNVGPRVDGTIEREERERLLAIGDWLDVHGEAIYETRPWDAFGEGPTRLEEGGEFIEDVEYGPEDARYTRSKDGSTVYAIVMGWPGAGELVLEGMTVDHPSAAPGTPPGRGGSPPGCTEPSGRDHDQGPPGKRRGTAIGSIRLLGHGPVPFAVSADGHPVIDVPDLAESARPSDVAVAFALEGVDLEPSENAHR
ncbi:alpha-L-fucosidase [Haloterrigena sp. SYSU A121-1]|uniref:alpha-L-fucosidase n=1 Tax=Haloterrigena gelatinilytica TaxID=2741724 RepID=A0A8J8GPF0_9EURY|nr:alpha-L-fucosidase [Haloterrigena gelatinilytica]NUB93426.1 alpha-L-fucosidase [Haloterrigena gelatinilytica]